MMPVGNGDPMRHTPTSLNQSQVTSTPWLALPGEFRMTEQSMDNEPRLYDLIISAYPDPGHGSDPVA